MKIKTSELKSERQWRANTGLDKDRFFKLLEPFRKSYIEIYGKELSEGRQEINISYCVTNEEDLLLFTLFSLKSGLTYDSLGFVTGMDGSNAKRNQTLGLEILNKTLSDLGFTPESNLLNANEFSEYFENHKNLIIDATEQRIQRPSDQQEQKDFYSGKKKPTP